MKTKILALLLVALMLLPMVACTQTPTGPAETTPPAGNTDPADTDPNGNNPDTDPNNPGETDPVEEHPLGKIPDVNYNKEEFVIYSRTDRYETSIFLKTTDKGSSSVDRAVWQRTLDMQGEYNLIFEVVSIPSTVSTAVSNTKAKTDSFGFAGDHGRYGWNYAAEDLLYLWNDLPYVDLEQDYWAQGAVEEWSTPGGKHFLMTGDLTHWNVGSAFVMFFNKEVFSLVEDELTSPYELVRADKWYYDTFEEYARTLYSNMDGDGSGEIASDSFGYATTKYRGCISIIPSTGIKLLEKNENSATGYKVNATKDRVVTAVGDLAEFLVNDPTCYYDPNSTPYAAMRDAFMAARLAFYDDEVNNALTFTQKATEFGIVPWPKYDRRTAGYSSNVNAGCDAFFIPKNTSAAFAERISIVLETLAYYGQQDVIPLYYDTVLTYQGTRDEDSVEMLKIVKENLVYDFHYWFGLAGSLNDIGSKVISGNSVGSLGRLYDEIKTTVEEGLKTWSDLDYTE
jgi:hypothetical protein